MVEIVIGNVVTLQATVQAQGGLADPSAIVCKVRTPKGAVVVVPCVKDSTGVYLAEYTPAVAGVYKYRFEATGAVVAAGQGAFSVTPSET